MTAPTDDRDSAPTAADSGASGKPEPGTYGQQAPGAYPPPPQANAGRGFTIAGFVLAAISLVLAPIILGPIGAVLGFVGYSKGDPKGRVAGLTAIVCTVLGLALSLLVLKHLRH